MSVASVRDSAPEIVRIHAAIADGQGAARLVGASRGFAAVALWYYVRALDRTGVGWADIDLIEVARALGKSEATVRRYLRNGRERLVNHRTESSEEISFSPEGFNWFRCVQWQGVSRCRVFYHGLFAVARSLNLQNWGATIEIPLSQLSNWGAVRAQVVEAELARLQAGSRYHADRDLHSKRATLSPEQIVQSSLYSRGAQAILYHGKRSVFVAEDFSTYGVSQATLAARLARSSSTIYRRLSNHDRVQRGLDPIDRRQLLRETNLDPGILTIARIGKIEIEDDRPEPGILKAINPYSRRVYLSSYQGIDRVFQVCPSVYCVRDQELVSMRRSRSRYKAHLKLLQIYTPDYSRTQSADIRLRVGE